MKQIVGIVLLVLLFIALFSLGGILTIMSINALFGTAIVINFWNWAAMTYLTAVFAPVKYLKLNK